MIEGILLSLLALTIGAVGGIAWVIVQNRQELEAAREESDRIRRRVSAEVEAIRREGEASAREHALAIRGRLERARSEQEDRYAEREAAVSELAESLSADQEAQDTAAEEVEGRAEEVQAAVDRAKSIRTEADALTVKRYRTLQELAGQSDEECRAEIAGQLVDEASAEASDRLRNVETEPGASAIRQAKRIMGISVERIDSRHLMDRQSYNVELDAKKKAFLQGDGSAYLKELEETTGVTIGWINDGAAVRIETGGGVARVTARRALERILTLPDPGPDKVAKVIDEAAQNVKAEVMGKGKQAFRLLGLRPAHPEITELVGRLCFRTSYTQNQWEHVLEVAHLAGLMASELNLNVKLARRAGLLHDIGKALTHEVEGSHALIGAEIAERHGEPPEVVGAIGEHHAEKPTSSVYTLLVGAADAISGARPGARRELVETYGERIAVLEELATAFRGVHRAHAVQAGREVRVLVDEKKIDDQRAAELATEIARKISEELSFPGQIQVTVIREFAAQEFAN